MGGFGKFKKSFTSKTLSQGDAGLSYSPDKDELDVGYIQLKGEQANAPAQPPDGDGGFIYSKGDGKVYWRSNEIEEVDLTAAGSGGTAGSDTQLQYNNDGAAGGASNLAYNDSTGYLGMGASGGDVTHRLTLPNTDGVGGRVKANAYVTYSSKRYKNTVQSIENPIELLNKIEGVTYKWNDSGRTDIGFIAEEVGKVLPCVVDYEKNGVDAIAMDYTRINAVLVEAVKEQNKILEQQSKQLEGLKKLFGDIATDQKEKFKSILTLLKRT
jgi:hypothetical protein